jgi:4-amino-4-deoxy-L-arabinose transferase-like glycosyltransferase
MPAGVAEPVSVEAREPAGELARIRHLATSYRMPALVTAGLGLLYAATRLALLWRFPPYFDEAFYAHEVPIALYEPSQRFISLDDDKGPLLIWFAFVPLKIGFSPLTSVRLVAQVAGLWTMAMIGLVTRQFAGLRTSLLAMALFAVLPLWLVFTSMGLDEPLVTAAGMTAMYLLIRLADAPTARNGLLLGLALAIGLLTKETAKIDVVLLPSGLLLLSWRRQGLGIRLTRWVGSVLLALVVAYGFYSIERLSPTYYELGRITKSLGLYTPLGTALQEVGSIFQRNWPGYRVELDNYLTVPLVLAGAVGWALVLAQSLRRGLFLALWIVPPLAAVALIATRPMGHYLLPAVTPVVVPMAIGLVAIWRAVASRIAEVRLRNAALLAVGAIAIVPALWFDARFIADPSRTQLPAYDDRELITDAAAGGGLKQMTEIIARRSAAEKAPVTVAYAGMLTYGIPLLLGDPMETRYPYVSIESQSALRASYVVAIGGLPPSCLVAPANNVVAYPSCSQLPLGRLRPLSVYRRPRGGSVVTLYQVLAPPPPAAPARAHAAGGST